MEGGKSSKMRRGAYFFFHFSKWLKFVLGLPKWKFPTGKKHFTPGKKVRKNDFAPSEKFSCYAPGITCLFKVTFIIHCTSMDLDSLNLYTSLLLKIPDTVGVSDTASRKPISVCSVYLLNSPFTADDKSSVIKNELLDIRNSDNGSQLVEMKKKKKK